MNFLKIITQKNICLGFCLYFCICFVEHCAADHLRPLGRRRDKTRKLSSGTFHRKQFLPDIFPPLYVHIMERLRNALKEKKRYYLGIFPKRRTPPYPPFWEPLIQKFF